jgi:hypothetical protein
MKRIGGKVIWEVRFNMVMTKRIRQSRQTMTIQAGHHVCVDDAVRLTDCCGETMQEIDVESVRDLLIHIGGDGAIVILDGRVLSRRQAEHIAKQNGYADVCDMVSILSSRHKAPFGVFDGQLIGW